MCQKLKRSLHLIVGVAHSFLKENVEMKNDLFIY